MLGHDKLIPTGALMICAAATAVAAMADGPTVEVKPGWDWSLPAHVKPTPYSGYVTWGNKRFDPAITVRGLHVTWRRLNPEPGVYNWDWLEDEIGANTAAGMRTGIHVKGVQRDAVPDWVIEKFKPVVLDVPALQENQPWRIQTVPPWQPEIDRAFHGFLSAFAKTGIAQRDEVVYGYIHGISASRGEEMFIRPVDLEMWRETTGLTAEQFASWLRRRTDAMCQGFKGAENKLAVMFGGALGPTAEYRGATEGLCEYAIERGAGIRGGGIDFMHGLFNEKGWGSRVDRLGYCIVDDDHPTIKERRFRGDENEEYGKPWEWRFGPVEGYPYRHRICVLRGLQMRQNFQMVSKATLELNPELNEYARIVQGYRRDDSPDAWAYLRECQTNKNGRVKNMERWLIQRDLPGSQTVADQRIDRHPISRDKPDVNFDFDARRTDLAGGRNGMLFKLDRVFWPKPASATVKVTYTDKAKTAWRIHYTDAPGKAAMTPIVNNIGDGKLKTATFRLAELSAAGAFPNDPIFHEWEKRDAAPSTEIVKNEGFSREEEGWSVPGNYRVVPEPERDGKRALEFSFVDLEDTPHVDQLVDLKADVAYRVSAEILNEGQNLRPCVRVASMSWSTVVIAGAEKSGEWEEVSEVFTAAEDGQYRLQLFGQGRQHRTPGQSGKSYFRNVSVRSVPMRALLDNVEMDFRIETTGPGDLSVTFVRVIKNAI
jgi:hypothetical protein